MEDSIFITYQKFVKEREMLFTLIKREIGDNDHDQMKLKGQDL